MKRFLICTVALAGIITPLLSAYAEAAEPNAPTPTQAISILEQKHRFSQTKIGSCESLPSVLHWEVSDIRYGDGDLTIQGVDRLGRRYSIVKGTGMPGCEIWAVDFEGNGEADLAILTAGQDSSGGYESSLTPVLFDADGRPFPWQATGKFTATDAGVDQILANPLSKAASIVVPTKEGITGPRVNLAFDLYSFSPSKIEKIKGQSLGMKWPVFDNLTTALLKHYDAASLAFKLDGSTATSQIHGSSTPKITGASDLSLTDGGLIKPPALLVVDALNGDRSINADPTPTDIERLVQTQAHIRTLGTACEEEECRPLVLVATP